MRPPHTRTSVVPGVRNQRGGVSNHSSSSGARTTRSSDAPVLAGVGLGVRPVGRAGKRPVRDRAGQSPAARAAAPAGSASASCCDQRVAFRRGKRHAGRTAVGTQRAENGVDQFAVRQGADIGLDSPRRPGWPGTAAADTTADRPHGRWHACRTARPGAAAGGERRPWRHRGRWRSRRGSTAAPTLPPAGPTRCPTPAHSRRGRWWPGASRPRSWSSRRRRVPAAVPACAPPGSACS